MVTELGMIDDDEGTNLYDRIFDDFYKEFTPNEWFDFVRYYASELFFGYILRIYEWILKNSNDNLFLEAYSIYRVENLGSTRNMDEKVYEMDKLLIENNKTAIILNFNFLILLLVIYNVL